MNTTLLRILSAGFFFLFIFASGFWLHHSGKPFRAVPFNIHKLIALAALIFLSITIYKIHQAAPLGTSAITAAAAALLCFVITIITGGLASIDKPLPAILTTLHRIFPYLTLLSTTATIYFVFILKR